MLPPRKSNPLSFKIRRTPKECGHVFLIDKHVRQSYYAFGFQTRGRSGLADSEKHGKGNKIFWALVLIVIGLFILLHNLGYVGEDIIRYWPVIIILLGVKKLID
jgi:hypothetical protein